MISKLPLWFQEEEHEYAIKRRLSLINEFEEQIRFLNKEIARLNAEIHSIELSKENNVAIRKSYGVENERKTISINDYKSDSSWFERAYFVLQFTKEYSTVKQIVMFLRGIDENLRNANNAKIRQAQAAITNALNVRVENKSIEVIEDDKTKEKRYGFIEWGFDIGTINNK
jgi:uncharacterized small protein (DUF1192 family)